MVMQENTFTFLKRLARLFNGKKTIPVNYFKILQQQNETNMPKSQQLLNLRYSFMNVHYTTLFCMLEIFS